MWNTPFFKLCVEKPKTPFFLALVDKLTPENRIRMVGSLCRLCCKQINTENVNVLPLGTLHPWIILHYILMR